MAVHKRNHSRAQVSDAVNAFVVTAGSFGVWVHPGGWKPQAAGPKPIRRPGVFVADQQTIHRPQHGAAFESFRVGKDMRLSGEGYRERRGVREIRMMPQKIAVIAIADIM